MTLEVIDSPFRDLTGAVLAYLEDLDDRFPGDTVMMLVPEFVAHRWWEHLLPNQSALALKAHPLIAKTRPYAPDPYTSEAPERHSRRLTNHTTSRPHLASSVVPKGPALARFALLVAAGFVSIVALIILINLVLR